MTSFKEKHVNAITKDAISNPEYIKRANEAVDELLQLTGRLSNRMLFLQVKEQQEEINRLKLRLTTVEKSSQTNGERLDKSAKAHKELSTKVAICSNKLKEPTG